ncbi:MAG: S8 family serine peptidase [Dehalococcoidia bacterium]
MTKAFISLVTILALLSVLAASPVLGGDAATPGEKVPVLIGFTQQPGPAEEALVRQAGGTIKHTYHLVPAIAAALPEAAIEGLQRNPNVTAIDLDGEVHIIDAELDNTWGVKRIGAGVVHDGGNKGTGVKVAVIDTGIDDTHPDLDANYAGGYDFVNNDPDPMDDHGHGTHVAGTVAAEDNGVGVVGVAPEARLYALKVLSASGGGYWSDIIAAMQWAVDNGIQVANLSLGSSTNPGGTVQAAFDNAEAAGILTVAAAGNSGNPKGKGNSVVWPARYNSVIAMAATDSNDNRASFSSTGDQVELAAPGVAVNSTLLGGGYGQKSGTSMASPHGAGTAALVIATGIADANGDGRINDEVRLKLQETADDLGDAGRDSLYGFGLVDADEAAASIGPPNDPPVVSITGPADGSTFGSGATISFSGTASDTEDGDLTASLVWTSDIDGQIGTGGSFSTTLTDGNHTITASVTDSGSKTGSASISITVEPPPNDAPVVSITSPADGSTFQSGATILFEGTASDTEDGDLSASIAWNSSIDGSLGTGASVTAVLSDGNHTITASVTDSGGKTGSASVSITVGNPPATGTIVSVDSITYATQGGKNQDKHLLITIALVDDLGNPVAGASVSVTLENTTTGASWSGTGITGENGTVTFSLKNAPAGDYTTTVTDVTADGLTWDGVTPPNGFNKASGSNGGGRGRALE